MRYDGLKRFAELIDRTKPLLRQLGSAEDQIESAKAAGQTAPGSALSAKAAADRGMDDLAAELRTIQVENAEVPRDEDTARITYRRQEHAQTKARVVELRGKIEAEPDAIGNDLRRELLDGLEDECQRQEREIRQLEQTERHGFWGRVFGS